MEEFKIIQLYHKRDFSNKINTTFEFIRQNFRSLGLSLVYIAGPSVLVGGLLTGSVFGDFMTLGTTLSSPEGIRNFFTSPGFFLQLGLTFLFFLLNFVISMTTVNSYIKLYQEKQTPHIPVHEVWARVKATFWTYLGTSLLLFLGFFIVYIVMLIPIFILARFNGFLVFIGVMGLIVGIFYIAFSASLTFAIQTFEKRNFFQSLTRSFYLVKGKWWSTFGLIVVLSLIISVISYIFLIPYYAVLITTTMHQVNSTVSSPSSTLKWVTFISLSFNSIMHTFLSTLPNIGICFQYFNLVELKESRGLINEIEQFGKPKEASEQRPEENY